MSPWNERERETRENKALLYYHSCECTHLNVHQICSQKSYKFPKGLSIQNPEKITEHFAWNT